MASLEARKLIHEGTLIKSPPESKSRDLGRWKKRHFKLWSNKSLEYFKNEKSEKYLKKPIDLSKCESIYGNLKNKKWDNIFCLNTKQRKYFLVADSPDGMEKWIEKLCEVCGFTVQAHGTIECPAKVKVKPKPGSPTYSKGVSSPAVEVKKDGQLSKVYTTEKCATLDSLPSYEKELPPIPDSSSESNDELESSTSSPPQSAPSTPYTSGIKQTKASGYLDASNFLYDKVPPPKIVEEVTIPTLKRQISISSESAAKNSQITNDSYVDMQPTDATLSKPLSKSNTKMGTDSSGYDWLPPPIPVGGANTNKYANYDMVPSIASKSDEYIPCEIIPNKPRWDKPPPPVPHQTYNGFDELPADKSILEKSCFSDAPLSALYHSNDSVQTVQGFHDPPPVPSRNEVKVSDDTVSDQHRRSVPEIYDTLPAPSRTGGEDLREIDGAPPVPSRNEVKVSDDTVSDQHRRSVPEIYDTLPAPRRTSGDGVSDTLADKHCGIVPEIYDTLPSASSTDRDDFSGTSPDQHCNNMQDIYNSPPVPSRHDRQNVHDDRTDSNRHNKISHTLPVNIPNGSHNLYDFPPASKDTGIQEVVNIPQMQNGRPDSTSRPEAGSLYDFPPRSESYNPRNDSLYDFPSKSQRFAGQNDLYDIPPVGQRQTMSHAFGARTNETTSAADIFNFGFSRTPPAIDRTLKHGSTGDIGDHRGGPPPIDRKNRPLLATSVPVFSSNVQRSIARDLQAVPEDLFESPPAQQ